MDDRGLLILAAKAARLEVLCVFGSGVGTLVHIRADTLLGKRCWDPLADDGDALRLATKLRLDLTFYNGFQEIHAEPSNGDGLSASVEDYGHDVCRAVRLAIVRAAAEIGKSMQELTK